MWHSFIVGASVETATGAGTGALVLHMVGASVETATGAGTGALVWHSVGALDSGFGASVLGASVKGAAEGISSHLGVGATEGTQLP